MGKVKLYYDRKGNTLTVWFDDPKKEAFSDEVEGEVVVMKDKKGKVIGFEKLNYLLPKKQTPKESFPTEVVVV